MHARLLWLAALRFAPIVYATPMTPQPSLLAPPRSSSSLSPLESSLSDMTTAASIVNHSHVKQNKDHWHNLPPLNQDEIDELLWKEAGYKKKQNAPGKNQREDHECCSRSRNSSSSSSSNDIHAVKKRQDYLSWDDYFFAVAALSAMRSKGACMVQMSKTV